MNTRNIAVGIVVVSLISFGGVANARADEPAPLEQQLHGASPDELEKFAAPREYEVTSETLPLAPRAERVVYTGPVTRSRSPGLIYGGVATGVGGIALLSAGLLIKTAHQPGECRHLNGLGAYVYGGDCAIADTASGLSNVGKYSLIGLGGLLMAGGVAMGVVGGWQVPITRRPPSTEPTKAPRSEASISIGPTSGSLRVSF